MEEQILIVCDEEDWKQRLKGIFEGESYTVKTVSSYIEASLELRTGQYNLMVTDLRLENFTNPENLDGKLLLEDAFRAGVSSIVVTGFGTPELAKEAYEEFGVFGFFEKKGFEEKVEKFKELTKEALAVKAWPTREELTPEQKKRFEETIRKIFRGETITFGRGA